MLSDEICARLNYLCEVGVGYLTLDRSTHERGAKCNGEPHHMSGASLVNTLFVMDRPSIGLHPRDVGRLVRDA
jgi:excinuclease ABC subunit A